MRENNMCSFWNATELFKDVLSKDWLNSLNFVLRFSDVSEFFLVENFYKGLLNAKYHHITNNVSVEL